MDKTVLDKVYEVLIVILQYAIIIGIFVVYRKKVRKKMNKYFSNVNKQKGEGPTFMLTDTKRDGQLNGANLLKYFLSGVAIDNNANKDDVKKQKVNLSLSLLPTTKLERHKKYVQIALNSTLVETQNIVSRLPMSDRIIIEAGTPLIKSFGANAVSSLKSFSMSPRTYIVADTKTADMGEREVEMMASVGASAATCLGVSPIETIDAFISACKKYNIDSMVDMMNVENPLLVLKKLKQQPRVVIVHRGVDETEENKSKVLPYYQINQIKGYNNEILVAIAGGDSPLEIQSAVFNGADIVVLWKSFYKAEGDVGQLVRDFLKTVK